MRQNFCMGCLTPWWHSIGS